MATLEPSFEEVLGLAKRLPPRQKLRLIEAIVPDLAAPLAEAEEKAKPLRSLYGLWKDLGSEHHLVAARGVQMQCAQCGVENPASMKFCGECGTPLKSRCPQCGFENPPRFKFCGECGVPLSAESRVQSLESHLPSP
jgi:predicted RNA-binding Zn-ribbon protein involved in translation (DUF1610 family)